VEPLHVDVNGANALPADGSGNGWTLCINGFDCGHPPTEFVPPAQDQYAEFPQSQLGNLLATGPYLTTTPQCDVSFSLASVTVTSTGLRGTMLINGAPMTPVGGGTPWALCGSTDGVAPACRNGTHVPGAEQYGLQPLTILSRRPLWLSNQPTCDSGFSQGPGPGGVGCVALPGDSATESVHLVGPASTADSAGSYSTTVTWTVVG
jgi:hypothetical protein